MHSLARAILAVLSLGMVAAASRPVGAPREMTLLVAAMLRDAPEVYTSTTEIRDLLIAEVDSRP